MKHALCALCKQVVCAAQMAAAAAAAAVVREAAASAMMDVMEGESEEEKLSRLASAKEEKMRKVIRYDTDTTNTVVSNRCAGIQAVHLKQYAVYLVHGTPAACHTEEYKSQGL